jgi:hypothetical protein
MLAALSADGSSLKPMIIIQRKTYEIDLFESGFTPDKVLIVHGERGFIDRTLFDLWAGTMFFPEIERRRLEYQYDGPPVLILDGCTSHESDWFLDEALTQQATLHTLHVLPPHSSDKMQALDLGLFGITKQALTKVRPDPEKSPQSNQLIRMLSACHVAATPKNIVGSFRRSGIVVRCEEAMGRGCLVAAVVPGEADRAQELYVHEQEEDETGDELLSDDELDDRVANTE